MRGCGCIQIGEGEDWMRWPTQAPCFPPDGAPSQPTHPAAPSSTPHGASTLPANGPWPGPPSTAGAGSRVWPFLNEAACPDRQVQGCRRWGNLWSNFTQLETSLQRGSLFGNKGRKKVAGYYFGELSSSRLLNRSPLPPGVVLDFCQTQLSTYFSRSNVQRVDLIRWWLAVVLLSP